MLALEGSVESRAGVQLQPTAGSSTTALGTVSRLSNKITLGSEDRRIDRSAGDGDPFTGQHTPGVRPSGSYAHGPMQGTLLITGDADADELLNTDPLALLLGMLLDQQVQ